MIHNLINKIKTVISGHHIKKARNVISKKSTPRKTVKSIKIKTVFTKIPIPIEKITSPFLYSFLRGLKKVRTIRGRERIWRTA